MGTLTNSEDADKIPQNAVFHQGLTCLLRQNQSSEIEVQYFLEIITSGPSIYTMDHPDFLYVALWKIPLVLKGLKAVLLGFHNNHIGDLFET